MNPLTPAVTTRVVTTVPLLRFGMTEMALAAGLTVVGAGEPAQVRLLADAAEPQGRPWGPEGSQAGIDVRFGLSTVDITVHRALPSAVVACLGMLVTGLLES